MKLTFEEVQIPGGYKSKRYQLKAIVGEDVARELLVAQCRGRTGTKDMRLHLSHHPRSSSLAYDPSKGREYGLTENAILHLAEILPVIYNFPHDINLAGISLSPGPFYFRGARDISRKEGEQ